MTHKPPVPPGNTSPYPLHEPVEAAPLPIPVLAERQAETGLSTATILAGIAGLGAVLSAGLLYAFRGKPSDSARSSGKQRRKAKRAA